MNNPSVKMSADVRVYSRRRAPRWLFHGSLLVAFTTTAAALLVWPQWVAVDGARTALKAQREQEAVQGGPLPSVHSLNEQLRGWRRGERRVFLEEEVAQYPALVQAMAKREGVKVLAAEQVDDRPARWRPASLDPEGAAEDRAILTGEIQPRTIRILLTGSFPKVYRAVASLCQQQQLFVPERWELIPVAPAEGGEAQLKADIRATIFVIREPEEAPAPTAGPGPMAARLPVESQP